MQPRNVDVTKAREATAAGWGPEQLARTGMIVQSGNPDAGARRFSGLQEEEIALGQTIEALGAVLAAEEGIRPARWFMSGVRLDVVANDYWTPITRWLDPRRILRMPRTRWDRTREAWERQGWTFRDAETMVPGWRESIERLDRETVPVPYVHHDPATKIAETYAFCTDARQERTADWMLEQQRWLRDQTGCNRIVQGFKSGIWDNWPSRIALPSGIVRFTAQDIWERAPLTLDGGPITIAHYQPGEFEAAFLEWLRRLLADGFEIVLNEAYAHRGRRWTWADENPDVADALVGEGVYREPWKAPAG